MSNRVLITCPHYFEGAGGVATFYKVFAAKQTNDAKLFFIGKDKPCGKVRKLFLLLGQYLRLFFTMHRYDLLVVNPSLRLEAIKRDTVSIRIAHFFGKKTCVFWRGFDEDYFNNVICHKYRHKLQRGLFNVDHTIVLGKNIYEKYHSIGLNTPFSFGSTMFDKNFLRTTLKQFSQERFCVLFLARVVKEKGIFEAIEAFSDFHHCHPESIFIIAGTGKDIETAKTIVTSQNLKAISFLGDVRGERKKACLETADVYLLPSYAEGMPNSVLEAMGMGLPIITSSVGAIPDFFEDGKMGILLQGHSSNDIFNALETLYHKKKTLPEISEYNREYAEKHFIQETVIGNLEKTFAEI